MSIIKEFREFAMRGNVWWILAVGVIIGAAFGKIVHLHWLPISSCHLWAY